MRRMRSASFIFMANRPGDTNHINYTEAAKWLHRAADQDYMPAIEHFGLHVSIWHRDGPRLAASAPMESPGRRPRGCHGPGQPRTNVREWNTGLPRDLVQAYKWFWLSDQQGNPGGRHDVIEIELRRMLTPNKSTKRNMCGRPISSPIELPPADQCAAGQKFKFVRGA